MNSIRDLLLSFKARSAYALSVSFTGGGRWRWVYGEIKRERRLGFKSIRASGGGKLEQWSKEDKLLASDLLQQAISRALSELDSGLYKPQFIVVTVPSRHAYLGEINVTEGESETAIRFQIQELMEAAAGQSDREAAFDWQVKASLLDGNTSLAVAGIDQRQVEEIVSACKACSLTCLGITLDSVAALNGYLQMAPAETRSAEVRFLLHGELSPHHVRLGVFSNGVLVNESWEHSEEAFTVVKAISALERLVSVWTRDGVPEEVTLVRLVLGGEMMHDPACEATARRSAVLASRLVAIPARQELKARWHDDVVPFGALEDMPCE